MTEQGAPLFPLSKGPSAVTMTQQSRQEQDRDHLIPWDYSIPSCFQGIAQSSEDTEHLIS